MAGTLVLCSGAVSRSCSPFSRRVCSEEGELTVSEVARRLGIGQGAVIHWINRGWLPARRGLNDRWCIPFDPAVEAQCRDRVARSVHIPRLDSSEPAG